MPRPYSITYADDWKVFPVKCAGGLHQDLDILQQSTSAPGSASILQNFEPSLEGGYKRILGNSKYDPNVVPGTGPVLGVFVGLNGAFACRLNTADNAIFFSAGAGWGTKINTPSRPGAVFKMRAISSYIINPAVIFCDGVNPAGKWDGTTWTTLNSTGAPTNPRFAATLGNRLILAGYGTNREITISEPNTDIAFTAGGGAASIPIADEIVGIHVFRSTLYIYCRNSIKALTGNTLATYAISDVTTSIGCISGDSIQELGGDVIFLAPDGFRSTAATSRIGDIELGLVSAAIQPLVRVELAKSSADYLMSSVVIRAKSQYRLLFNDGDSTEQNQIGFLGKLQEREDPLGTLQYDWATTVGIKPYCAHSAYIGNRELAVFGHPTDGYVRSFETSNSFDGVAIPAIYRTPELFFDSDSLRKVMQKLIVYTQVDGATNITLKMYINQQDGSIPQPVAIILAQGGSQSVYGTGIYGTAIYSAALAPTFKNQLVGSGTSFSFEFSTTDLNAPYRIDDLSITYSLKGFR